MIEKCPCQTDNQACCACVSMKCHECFKPKQSKFIQGRFCSNCGRPLKGDAMQVEYNVNNHIYIKLTNYGKELIIKKYGYSYFEACVESNKQENGYYQLQCHKVMSYFGEHLYNGCKMPFEPTVYFDEAELKKKCMEDK